MEMMNSKRNLILVITYLEEKVFEGNEVITLKEIGTSYLELGWFISLEASTIIQLPIYMGNPIIFVSCYEKFEKEPKIVSQEQESGLGVYMIQPLKDYKLTNKGKG